MSTLIKEKKIKRGKFCCIPNCRVTQSDLYFGTHFYRFPKGQYRMERRKQWILAIGKKNPDGSLWQPSVNSRICSQHFVGNKKSEHPHSPSYNPTIFPPQFISKPTAPRKMAESMDSNEDEENFRKRGIDLRENPEEEKRAKNTGKAYINCQGKLVPGRSVKEICVDSSKHPCSLDCGKRLIPENKREDIFRNFWNLPNRLQKYEFVCRHIRLISPKQKRSNPLSGKNRNYSRLYYLPIDGKLVRVCKKTFIATLGVNEQWPNSSLKKFGHLSTAEQLDQVENLQLESADENSAEEFEKKFFVDPEKKVPDEFMGVGQETEVTKFAIKEEVVIKEEVAIKEEVLEECELTQEDDQLEAIFFKEDLNSPNHSEKNDTNDEMAEFEESRSEASVNGGKSLKKACDNYCLYNCRAILEEQRQHIFQDFQKITDKFEKYQYISRLIEQSETKSEAISRRKCTRKYFLEINGEFRRVCRIMFMATLDLTFFQIEKALKQLGARAVISVGDMRDTEIGPIL
ncbi:uncharacterized protein LOC117181760 isoform X2 [Belonocnema kinseyi]|uniref:uncharacterized protein LOC117181760 isoform X2 n=1 Tax=Belonocnema kinseyi TaxID=2817044 RepID=UPI00143DEBFF|nr:uncharacterized protein LOC117181760 isoform X2 [Belonocnema kinseyi]